LDSAADYYNLYVLDLLHAFDSSQRPIFLDTAKKILGMIENGLDSSVFMINTCQIERREQKNLSTYEVSQLLELAGNEDDTVKLSALILLEQKDGIVAVWNEMSQERKSDVLSWPICSISPVILA
jgi:hypothetical protein